ncbi:MAG: OsmC family protein [Candidatus Thermoplasmatota archaeon]|nr:OsmC family protein [Candidatus Thermoplasmatota archaeon]
MPTKKRKANAVWNGDLKGGKGTLSTESGALEDVAYDFRSRFEEGDMTNPEELVAAAHAGCFSMALANGLAKAGHEPESIRTEATFHLNMDSGPKPKRVHLVTHGKVAGIDQATFEKFATEAKENCPISQTLAALEITLEATLES